MINRKIAVVMAVLFSILLIFSCTAPIDINTRDSEPVVVIYGCFTNENANQKIRVMVSSPYFDETPNMAITDAKVTVKTSSGREYTFHGDEDGYYFSNRRFSVVPGVTYYLTVEVDYDHDGKNEIYEAESTTPPMLPADSIEIKAMSIMGYRHYALNLYMQDPPGVENWYLFKYMINDPLSNDNITDYIISDDAMFDGRYMNGISITYFEDMTDPKVAAIHKDNPDVVVVYPGDQLRLLVSNIEKGYYEFISQCMQEKSGENPFFGGPPSNITTNLSGGAIGYFTSYCIFETETVFPAFPDQK